MTYKEIQDGARSYRIKNRRYVRVYDYYFNSPLGPRGWRNSSEPNPEQVVALMSFLGDFGVPYHRTKVGDVKFRDRFQKDLKKTLAETKHLRGKMILDVDFDEHIVIDGERKKVSDVMKKAFNASGGYGGSSASSSKILHVINPELFVMWDEAIWRHYVGRDNTARGYVDRFLPEMKRMAEAMDAEKGAVKLLTPCSHSQAKVLDEYNFMETRPRRTQ